MEKWVGGMIYSKKGGKRMDTTEAHERDEYRMSPATIGPPHEIWVPAGVRLTDEQIRELCGNGRVLIIRASEGDEDD